MGLLRVSYWFTLLFAVWVVLSTVVPFWIGKDSAAAAALIDLDGYLHTSYYNPINTKSIVENGLTNSHILLVTAHPDDESMFFTPTITELKKRNYNNKVHILCMSDGDYNGLGKVRRHELANAARILDIDSWNVLNYVDDIKTFWDTNDLSMSINSEIRVITDKYKVKKSDIVILTFDENGVSDHPNHKSLYQAAKMYTKRNNIRCFTLKSWNLFTKYSSVVVSIYELALRWLLRWEKTIDESNLLNKDLREYLPKAYSENAVVVYSDLNSLFLNLSTMTWAHYSQIVWFRWIWIFMSKYMNSNELVKLN